MYASGGQEGTHVGVPCPACSPEEEQVHEVLSGGGHVTVRCQHCGHVHKTTLEEPSPVSVRVIVSLGEHSERTSVEVPGNETLMVGEEFVAELPDGPIGVRITSLETTDGDRVEQADVTSVSTIWTRAVDNVVINATIHPSDGRHDETVSESISLPGDETLTVGEPIPHREDTATVDTIMLREDAIGYDRRKLDSRGRSAPAKDISRIYARQAGGDRWRSPWE